MDRRATLVRREAIGLKTVVRNAAIVRNRDMRTGSRIIQREIIGATIGDRRLRILDMIADRNPRGLPIVASVMITAARDMKVVVAMTIADLDGGARRSGRL